MADKRFYWLKLKENFYADDGPADFLMSQKDGANYVVLYQMLCLKTINSQGRLENQIGDYLIRYDIDKIHRIGKYFPIDTIRMALNLYKALGLVYEEKDGTIVIANYDALVGSETGAAERKRRQRFRENEEKALLTSGEKRDSERDKECDSERDNVTIDIEIEKDIRDRDIESKDIEKEKENLTLSNERVCRTKDVRRVIEEWNQTDFKKIERISPDSKRGGMVRKRINDYGVDKVIEAIHRANNSKFLKGYNSKGWEADFGWFIRPENFQKVLEGNYDNREEIGGSYGSRSNYGNGAHGAREIPELDNIHIDIC